MTKQNLVDVPVDAGKEAVEAPKPTGRGISQELETAIELLIYRLRELGPIECSG